MEPIQWQEMLTPDTHLVEIFVRGSVMYLALFVMMRLMLNRQAGAVGVTDLLVVVLIADAAQNGMAGDYKALPDGILLAATLLFWAWTLDYVGFRVQRVGALVHPKPLELVRDGVVLARNMRRELVTHEELMTQLREQGVESLAEVKTAKMEGNGQISVIKATGEQHEKRRRQQT